MESRLAQRASGFRTRTATCCGSISALGSPLPGKAINLYIASGRYDNEEDRTDCRAAEATPESARDLPSPFQALAYCARSLPRSVARGSASAHPREARHLRLTQP